MCSNVLQLDQSIELSGKDLLIGAEILSSGVYKVELIVTMVDDPLLSSSAFTYIEITRSIVMINLISFNATKIEQNIEENLTLNPGEFSVQLDQSRINKNVCLDFFCS